FSTPHDFVLEASEGAPKSWGVENPEAMATWATQTRERLREIGAKLDAGEMGHIQGLGLQRHVGLTGRDNSTLCVGFRRDLTGDQVLQNLKQIFTKWVS